MDRSALVYRGTPPNTTVCDQALRILPGLPAMLAYPDGEVDADERFIHFVFDYNRHGCIYWGAELPPV